MLNDVWRSEMEIPDTIATGREAQKEILVKKTTFIVLCSAVGVVAGCGG
jgi:hypothetical protein